MYSRFIRDIAVAATLLLLCGAAAGAALADTGYRIISTDKLKNWLESTTPPTLIFSLSQMEFEEQRIPGSICIPIELMGDSTDMPTSTDLPMVFYCKGPG